MSLWVGFFRVGLFRILMVSTAKRWPKAGEEGEMTKYGCPGRQHSNFLHLTAKMDGGVLDRGVSKRVSESIWLALSWILIVYPYRV